MNPCSTCGGSGYVDPWAEDRDVPCPDCNVEGFLAAFDYFEVSDARLDRRFRQAERSHLSPEPPFSERQR